MANRVSETFSQSKVEPMVFKHFWRIEHFSCTDTTPGEKITSSVFIPNNCKDKEIKLKLIGYPGGKMNEDKNYFSLYLELVDTKSTSLWIKHHFEIYSSLKTEDRECCFPNYRGQRFAKGTVLGYDQFIKRKCILKKDNGFLNDDGSILVICTGSILGEYKNNETCQVRSAMTIPESTLHQDLKTLLTNGPYDVTLTTAEGFSVGAHKGILGCRSPVFHAMFMHNTTEKATNKVDIPDMKKEVLQELLSFMYTDTCENVDLLASELLQAADKYQLDRLKAICEESLMHTISVANACNRLMFSDLYRAKNLKEAAMDFMLDHRKEIIKTQGWDILKKNHSDLLSEMFGSGASQRSSVADNESVSNCVLQ